MRHDPVSLDVAAARLRKAQATIRVWGTRYGARKIRLNGRVWWDYNDLATIEGCIHRGDPVPATPQERDQLRERRAARQRNAA